MTVDTLQQKHSLATLSKLSKTFIGKEPDTERTAEVLTIYRGLNEKDQKSAFQSLLKDLPKWHLLFQLGLLNTKSINMRVELRQKYDKMCTDDESMAEGKKAAEDQLSGFYKQMGETAKAEREAEERKARGEPEPETHQPPPAWLRMVLMISMCCSLFYTEFPPQFQLLMCLLPIAPLGALAMWTWGPKVLRWMNGNGAEQETPQLALNLDGEDGKNEQRAGQMETLLSKVKTFEESKSWQENDNLSAEEKTKIDKDMDELKAACAEMERMMQEEFLNGDDEEDGSETDPDMVNGNHAKEEETKADKTAAGKKNGNKNATADSKKAAKEEVKKTK